MKAIKKILATLMCLCLIFGCVSMTAFAEGTATGSITIQDQSGTNATVAGKTLNLFKIFNATSSGSNISYNWIERDGEKLFYSFFFGDENIKDGEGKQIYTNRVGEGKNSINDVVAYLNNLNSDSFNFSQMTAALHQYIHDYNEYYTNNPIEPTTSTNDEYANGIPAGATSYTFKDLELGYYMIYDATELPDDSPAVRSAAMLAHPGENKTIQLKAVRPHIVKYVDDNDASDATDWQLGTTANIGDTVTFRIVTAIPDHDLYGDKYTFEITDKMADTLQLVGDSIKVTVTEPTTINEGTVPQEDAEYDIITNGLDAGVDFKVVITNTTELAQDTLVEIVYDVKVLSTAAASNKNIATLTYSNDPNKAGSTGQVDATATVAVWQLTLTKHLEDTNGTPSFMRLAGAEFEIYKVDGDTETLLKFSGDETTGKYVFDHTSGITTLKTLNTGDGNTDVGYTDGGNLGQLVLFGLGEGTYRIYETKAPDGYQKADNPFEFTLTDTIGQTGAVANAEISQVSPEGPGQFTRVHVDEAAMKYYLGITNAPGSALPETGGMGTTLFTIVGIVLMAGAVAFFTSRKRSSAV